MNIHKTLQSSFIQVLLFSLLIYSTAQGQNVGISSGVIVPDGSSMLEVRTANKGILIPQVPLTGINDAGTIGSPATSLLVYCTGTGGLTPAGYYYNSGTPFAPVWKRFATGSGDSWLLLGNTGTVAGTNFLGTTDAQDLVFKTNNTEWMRIVTAGNVGIGTTTPNATSKLHIYQTGALAQLLLQSNGHDNAFAGGQILFNNDVIGNAQGNITFVNDAFGSAFMNGGITYFPNAYSINGDGPWLSRYSNMAIGTTLFVSDVENGTVIKKVGIGTTTPQNSLDVSNANGLGVAIGTYAGINVAPSGGMIVSGNVGVGTSAPASNNKVEVDYTTAAGTGLWASSIGNNIWPYIVNGVVGITLNNSNGIGRGVWGQSTSTTTGSARNWGVVGYASNGGSNVGVKGYVVTSGSNNTGVLGLIPGFNPSFDESSMGGPWAGYFSGNVAFEGALQANGSFGTAGQVLTSNGAGATYWGAAGGTSLWTQSGNYIYPNSNSNVQIDYNGAHTYGIYIYKASPASGPANYFYDGGTGTGTDYTTGQTAVIRGYKYNGYAYTAGIQGWTWGDNGRSSGVEGYNLAGACWGSLGYRNSAPTPYGGYFTSTTTGTGFMPSGNAVGIGSGSYGGIMGGWSRGEVLGFTSCGELYAAYNIGNVYTSGHQAEIVNLKDKRVAAYSLTSTDIKIYNDGKAKLVNGKIRVNFDASFAEMIGDNTPVVTISPMGQCNGIFIKNVDSKGFEVEELNSGNSNVEFSFIVIGKRIDADDHSKLPEAISDKEFDTKMKGVMFNENNSSRNATPIWWDGSKIRFDNLPETGVIKKTPEINK
jgi:hypothetical protein